MTKTKYLGGCRHDDCDTCPYPDCIATSEQIHQNKCGSESIPSTTDIRLPREYKPQADPPKVKAVIRTKLTGGEPDGGKAMDAEERKRKKHEYYLKSKAKKAAAKKADPVKVKEPEKIERGNIMQLDIDEAIEMMKKVNADTVEYKLERVIEEQKYNIRVVIETQ